MRFPFPVQPDLFDAGDGLREAASPRDARAVSTDDHTAELRQRLLVHGPGALDETDVIELILARCASRGGDPAALAEALVARFGDAPRILGATAAELIPVVGERIASELRLIHHLLERTLAFRLRGRCLLSSWDAVQAYLRASLVGRSREIFRVLFLDKANQLIADEAMGEGTVDHAPVYPREIMRRALELAASGCCLVHNHPSGAATPSGADVEMTRQVVEAGRALRIAVHDHYLVGGDDVVSFRRLGLM
jgi:DNA repair protein RadC